MLKPAANPLPLPLTDQHPVCSHKASRFDVTIYRRQGCFGEQKIFCLSFWWDSVRGSVEVSFDKIAVHYQPLVVPRQRSALNLRVSSGVIDTNFLFAFFK
jgi:hypothetical protein